MARFRFSTPVGENVECARRVPPGRGGRLAAATARHYAPRGVRHWEVWNEPNTHLFWEPAADPAAYARLLRLTYRAIKRADAGATVLNGGSAILTGEGNIPAVPFLEALY